MTAVTPASVFQDRGPAHYFVVRAETWGRFVFYRNADGTACVDAVQRNGDYAKLPQRFVYHSPTGFEWGYLGSGPHDLALNLLALFVEPWEAWALHDRFTHEVVQGITATAARRQFLTAEEIRGWILAVWNGSPLCLLPPHTLKRGP